MENTKVFAGRSLEETPRNQRAERRRKALLRSRVAARVRGVLAFLAFLAFLGCLGSVDCGGNFTTGILGSVISLATFGVLSGAVGRGRQR